MLREWENHLRKKEKDFEEMRQEIGQKIREKEQDTAQKLHAIDLKRADLDEAECSFKKVQALF